MMQVEKSLKLQVRAKMLLSVENIFCLNCLEQNGIGGILE